MLLKILARSSWQFYKQHPAQLLLSILGIVLGVGIVTAVLITNNSSQRAFALSSEALYGRTTHQISSASGLDQSIYVDLVKQYPRIPMAPVVSGYVSIGNSVFSILGVDAFAESAFNRAGSSASLSAVSSNIDRDSNYIGQIINNPRSLLISNVSARNNQLNSGEVVDLQVGGHLHTATIAATFTSDNPAAATGLLIGDISFVQSLLQRQDKIDRIDLILDESNVSAINTRLNENLQLTPAALRMQTMQAMTRGFQINLTAMSLLALIVGVFLIHNTMTFAVVQRRELFAIKRIIGVSSRALLFTILAESVIISIAGSVLGIVLGCLLATELVKLTTRTINDLYFVLHIQNVWFSPWLILGGLVLGVGSSLAAAAFSALDAASTSPVQARLRSSIEQRRLKIIPAMALAGIFIAALGIVLALLPVQSLLVGFGALMLIILGYGLFIPWIVARLSSAAQAWLERFSFELTLAANGIYRNISRTGLAIAALTIAVSATFGVDIMIGSFRTTVDHWLASTLRSDIYISAPSTVATQQSRRLNDRTRQIVSETPGIAAISSGVVVDAITEQGAVDMLVLTPHNGSYQGFELLNDETEKSWDRWHKPAENAVMISEPLATKRHLGVGDHIALLTDISGEQLLRVAGIFRDFGSSHGKLLIARSTYDQYWHDTGIGSLGIVLDNDASSAQTLALLRSRLAVTGQPLSIQSNTEIHRLSLAVFDRTFEVTKVLRWLTVGVAFVGIFSALLALHLERAKEFAIMRACGATRGKVMHIVLNQTLMMGLLAGVLAMPLGWLMSEILINVINVRSFGWSMQSTLPPGTVPEALLLACVSATLAGLYPALRLSRRGIASQLRDE